MKRLMGLILVLIVALTVLAGCTSQPASSPAPAPAPAPKDMKVYQGLGKNILFRNGPGADESKTPVYSFTYVTADATFDANGKILDVYIDSLEVATPNYDGESMPHFPGWPGTEGYNNFDHKTKALNGKSVTTPEEVAKVVNGWQTKRDRGDGYGMNPYNEWYKQMNYYQNFFKGKTIAEIEAWATKFTAANGRPLDPKTTNAADKAKFDKLTADEQKQIVDMRTGATMSINDAHGNIVAALKDAFKNKREVTIAIPAAK